MKKIMTKIAAFGTVLTMVAMLVLPKLSFAENNYVVSSSFMGTSTMTVAQANQICMSLPNSVAAQYGFCMPGPGVLGTTVAIPDNAILIRVTSPTSAHITWYTNVPTTTKLWFSDIPGGLGTPVEYMNVSEGYSTTHSIDISGINLMQRHTFRVGGSLQGTNAAISSIDQVI